MNLKNLTKLNFIQLTVGVLSESFTRAALLIVHKSFSSVVA
jgi:hypothetical protein